MATSRLLYSMAKDHVLPGWFGRLHPRYKTPMNAIIFVMIISLFCPWFGRTVLNWIVDMSSIGAAIGYCFTSAAAFVQLQRNKDTTVWLEINAILGVLFCAAYHSQSICVPWVGVPYCAGRLDRHGHCLLSLLPAQKGSRKDNGCLTLADGLL